jgi:hypothetical protein
MQGNTSFVIATLFFIFFLLSDILNKEQFDFVAECILFKAASHYISIIEVNWLDLKKQLFTCSVKCSTY